MSDSSENKPSGQNLQIILALIGLVGAVSSGVFANWDKIFPATSTPPVAVESTSITSGEGSAASNTGAAAVESSAVAATTASTANPDVSTNGVADVPAVANESVPQNLDLSGTWESSVLGITEIKQNGDTVRGSYQTADNYGSFEGAVIENRLEYRWWQDDKRKSSYDKAETRGTGSFTIGDNGRLLVGRWEGDTGTGGEWSLIKKD